MLSVLGYKTLMIRNEDIMIYNSNCETIRAKKVSDIHNRMEIINQHPESLFISIHQNYFEQSKYSGAQVFYSKNNADSSLLADCIQRSIATKLQKDNVRRIMPSGTNIYLLYHASSPAIMVECGFLSNPGEAQLLNDESYQTKLTLSIADGIINYLNAC